jgi:hypothetical protein
METFAEKFVAALVYVEHVAVPNALGKVTRTDWDGKNFWYEAEAYDEDTANKIRRNLIRHVSVGADYETGDILDGKVPHGLHNAELNLVAAPGIPRLAYRSWRNCKQENHGRRIDICLVLILPRS